MRPSALLGLVVSLLLGAIAVSVTLDGERAKRNEQDRVLQTATSSEIARITDGERQTSTALSLMLVNPAVRGLLAASPVSDSVRHSERSDAAAALAAIQGASFVPLSAACLVDGAGHQVACASDIQHAATGAQPSRAASADAALHASQPPSQPHSLGPAVTQQLISLARNAGVGAVSAPFLSPVSGQLSVAFLAPFRMGGRLLGLVHLDISVVDTRGSSLVVNEMPGVQVALASYGEGRLLLDAPASGSASSAQGGAESQATLALGALRIGSQPRFISNGGHRAVVAQLPLTIGAGGQHVAVVATAVAQPPSFFNAWSDGMLAVLGLAVVMLIASVVALVLSNRGVRRELSTDPLTGLRNRRALMADLPRVCEAASEEQPAFLWFFDLNGFKQYNDSFGHVAGDALLARLGNRLAGTVSAYGRGYRLGGDEFCVLLSAPLADPHERFQMAREALSEEGGAFTVTASAGAVELPREAASPAQALRLADQRMYREKAGTRNGGAELITAVLQAALTQRHPELGEHSCDVAGDVRMLARTIGMDDDTINLVVKAGDLHDIGKLGIPDEILSRPGPLSPEEWEFMKRHTVMGEQIIAAAGPSLEQIAPLVRASHERWDGTGYPDRLAGEEIPLGARIIAICDSFRAMLDERVYKPALTVDQALAELRRCAGTQFDPQLVEVFCRLVTQRMDLERVGSVVS